MLALTSIEAITWPRPGPNGLLPVKVRIVVKGGGRDYIPLNSVYTHPSYWDEKKGLLKDSHPDSKKHNETIALEIKKVQDKVTQLSLDGQTMSAKQLKAAIGKKDTSDLLVFFQDYLDEEKKLGHISPETYQLYDDIKNVLKEFCGGTLLANDVDEKWLTRFEMFLTGKYAPGTVASRWVVIKSWFTAAVKKEVIKKHPYLNYDSPTGLAKKKDFFSMDQINLLEKLADDMSKPHKKRQTAAWLLLGCYFGLRVSDWYRFDYSKQVVDEMFRIRPKKTHKHDNWVSMPLFGAFKRTIERVQLCPLTITYWGMRKRIIDLMDEMEIELHITPHSTRKTFAVTICQGNDIGVDDCAEYMGITAETCRASYYEITSTELHKRTAKKLAHLT